MFTLFIIIFFYHLALCFHSAAEYIVYKLREMGKVSNEDIAIVVEGFKNLDVDHSGTLTVDDIKLMESQS